MDDPLHQNIFLDNLFNSNEFAKILPIEFVNDMIRNAEAAHAKKKALSAWSESDHYDQALIRHQSNVRNTDQRLISLLDIGSVPDQTFLHENSLSLISDSDLREALNPDSDEVVAHLNWYATNPKGFEANVWFLVKQESGEPFAQSSRPDQVQ